jgi:alginate O-acetyltransferase complex protein AlgI
MALGTARLFNIKLTDNFNSPYLATSIAEFWRRWHITFSRWILDYIFKPLQMSWRNWKNWGTASALLVTFLVSGIWHGASWGFVIWGLLHGFYMACSVLYRPYQKKIHKALKLEKTKRLKAWQIFVTFNLVCFAWIFFRSNDVWQAFYIIKNAFNLFENLSSIGNSGIVEFIRKDILLGLGRYEVMTISLLMFVNYVFRKISISVIFTKPIILRWAIYYSLIFSILFFYKTSNGFIYFKF